MKAFLICLVAFVFSFTLNAQNTQVNQVKRRVVEIQPIASITETVFHKSLIGDMGPRVLRGIGCHLGGKVLCSRYTWSVNITAGIYPGVQTIDGNIPAIRGAGPEGTAYYIDGIRLNNVDAVYDFTDKF